MTGKGRPTGSDLARWRKEQEAAQRAEYEGHALADYLIEQTIAAVLLEGTHLPDGARIVRGGASSVPSLVLNAETTRDRWGRPGISVHGSDALSTAQIVRMAGLPHSTIRKTTAGALRNAGFELEATSDPPHFTVWLEPDQDIEAQCVRVERCFEPQERRHTST